MDVSKFCVSSTISKSSDAMVLKHPSYKSHSFKSGSFTTQLHNVLLVTQNSHKIPANPKFSISVFPKNCNNFSYLILSVIKFNYSTKSTCAPSQTSYVSPLPLKSSKHLFQLSAPACHSIFSQNQKSFNLPPYFKFLNYHFQRNVTGTRPFTSNFQQFVCFC